MLTPMMLQATPRSAVASSSRRTFPIPPGAAEPVASLRRNRWTSRPSSGRGRLLCRRCMASMRHSSTSSWTWRCGPAPPLPMSLLRSLLLRFRCSTSPRRPLLGSSTGWTRERPRCSLLPRRRRRRFDLGCRPRRGQLMRRTPRSRGALLILLRLDASRGVIPHPA